MSHNKDVFYVELPQWRSKRCTLREDQKHDQLRCSLLIYCFSKLKVTSNQIREVGFEQRIAEADNYAKPDSQSTNHDGKIYNERINRFSSVYFVVSWDQMEEKKKRREGGGGTCLTAIIMPTFRANWNWFKVLAIYSIGIYEYFIMP